MVAGRCLRVLSRHLAHPVRILSEMPLYLVRSRAKRRS